MSRVTERLRRYGLRPKQSLAQNFLADERFLADIIGAAELTASDAVLEVGPGLGILTDELAAHAGRVVAVELDDRLVGLLRQEFADRPHVSIVHGDILELNPAQTAGAGAYKVVANLPYYITSAALRHLLETSRPPCLAVLMVQKEVAERICAKPGDMSLLALSVQFFARPQIVRLVPAEAFYPPPKVDSAILRLDVYPEPVVRDVRPDRYFTVARAGFGQRRKQLGNSLSANLGLPKETVRDALLHCDIDPRRRPETLTLEEWRAVCLALGRA